MQTLQPLTREYLSKEYQDLFSDTVHNFVSHLKSPSSKSREYCMLYPQVGLNYQPGRDFLLFGRALNSWKPIFTGKNIPDTFVQECMDYSKEYADNGKCPSNGSTIPGTIVMAGWLVLHSGM